MLKIPTPYQIPPTPQQVNRVLHSVILSSQHLIELDPGTIQDLRPIFLNFYANPIFTIILGLPTQAPQTPPHFTNLDVKL